ncbi:putative amidohydrolase YtcJ [Catenulispora sp. MAP12-49]|uniref:amidohydrolase n=1 Tax=Catenulispora sp. MAP12-49 TaxID=3156302 RepID=UPI003514365F
MAAESEASSRFADVVFTAGVVLTMNPDQPLAEAVAVRDGRVVAVGTGAEIELLTDRSTRIVDLGGRCLMPGFVEPHGHVTEQAFVLGPTVDDIRPVTIPAADDVVSAVKAAVTRRGGGGTCCYGWDPLLQKGLPAPNLTWLDAVAPDTPLVIVHNSGHQAFFNSAAATWLGLSKDTPDPAGARFGRAADGSLDGTAYEAGAVGACLQPFMPEGDDWPALLNAQYARLNQAGVTMCSDMAFDARLRPALAASSPTVRVRMYEMSGPKMGSDITPDNGDDLVRQVGIKTWADGSPWIGNIATSFPYLTNDTTRALGLEPNHRGRANYTPEQLKAISQAYFPAGWQLACHVQGDDAVDMVLDVWEKLLAAHPRDDHRLRLEHVCTMRPDQFERAAALGITASIFVDQLYYWGDVLVDDLFGPEHGAHYANAGSALKAGLRISFHNDAPVTPVEPLRNITEAVTRLSKSGRVLAPEERITVDQALRAQTVDAAWHLFADDITGSIEVGKYADFVVLDQDPHTIEPAHIADIPVDATWLAGQCVYNRSRSARGEARS